MGTHICSDCGGNYVAAPGGFESHIRETRHIRTRQRKAAEADGGLDQHLAVQNRIQLFASAALELFTDAELDEFLERCDRADTLGPLLDPTAWMAGKSKLDEVVAHARAVVALRKAIRKTVPATAGEPA